MDAVLVLAGNLRQFEWWCHEHEINPRDRSKVVYIQDSQRLRGRRGSRYVITGTFWDRRDADELHAVLRYIEAEPLEEVPNG